MIALHTAILHFCLLGNVCLKFPIVSAVGVPRNFAEEEQKRKIRRSQKAQAPQQPLPFPSLVGKLWNSTFACDFDTFLNTNSKQANDTLSSAIRIVQSTRSFNESCFFKEFNRCNKNEGCMRKTNDRHRPSAKLWNRKQEGTDCQYNLTLASVMENQGFLRVYFNIYQTKCVTNIDLKGGTTFDVFSAERHSLVNCIVDDFADDSYTAVCTFPHNFAAENAKTNRLTEHCFRVTAVVEYEHFDGYNDVQIQMQDETYYPPVRKFFVDAKLLCKQIEAQMNPPPASILGHDDLGFSTIQSFSGVWIKHPSDSLPVKSMFDSMQSRNVFAAKTYYYWLAYSRSILLVANASKATYPFFLDQYVFRPAKIVSGRKQLLKMSPGGLSVLIDRQLSHHYHFVGTSHMRYICDILALKFFGISLDSYNHLHGSTHFPGTNIHYHESRYAEQQAQTLISLCQAIEADPAGKTRKHTIIIHSSPWDLSYSSLRQFMRNPSAGPRLLCAVDEILNKKAACGGNLVHVVWLTFLPYPLCYNNTFADDCNESRGARNNAAISAANSYFLRALAKIYPAGTTVSAAGRARAKGAELSPRLSVVDAFSIVTPRLILEETSEFCSINHYICRFPDRQFLAAMNSTRESHKYPFILVTPGGEALLTALLHALSD